MGGLGNNENSKHQCWTTPSLLFLSETANTDANEEDEEAAADTAKKEEENITEAIQTQMALAIKELFDIDQMGYIVRINRLDLEDHESENEDTDEEGIVLENPEETTTKGGVVAAAAGAPSSSSSSSSSSPGVTTAQLLTAIQQDDMFGDYFEEYCTKYNTKEDATEEEDGPVQVLEIGKYSDDFSSSTPVTPTSSSSNDDDDPNTTTTKKVFTIHDNGSYLLYISLTRDVSTTIRVDLVWMSWFFPYRQDLENDFSTTRNLQYTNINNKYYYPFPPV